MKVYVITKGVYSDYHIISVALDKDKAQKIASLFSDDYGCAMVEEYDTDQYAALSENTVVYCFTLSNEGAILDVDKHTNFIESVVNTTNILNENGNLYTYVTVNDGNFENALKILHDRYAKYKAEKLGL